MRNAILVCVILLSMLGCAAKQGATLRPGALNQFDQQAYDVLRTTQATLEQAAKEVVDFPAAKPAYNAAVDAYNAAQAGYKAYHAALEKGQTADQLSVQALLDGLNAALAKYVAARKPVAQLWEWRVAA